MLLKEISIKDIILGDNIRQITRETQLNYLMQTIKDNGLLQPIGVKEISDNSYKILWGNRRLAACTKLGWKTIPAVLFIAKDEEMTEEEFTVINAIENLQQSPNTLFEIGRICKILKKTMSASEISVRLGISKSRIENALEEIQRVPVKWQKKIKIMETGQQEKLGYIPITSAIRIVQMRGLSKEHKDKIFEYLSKNDVSVGQLALISSIVASGKEVKEAIKEADKYTYVSVGVYCDKKILEEELKKYPSRVDMVVTGLNKLAPGIAIKKL